jgi:hypothetical protein
MCFVRLVANLLVDLAKIFEIDRLPKGTLVTLGLLKPFEEGDGCTVCKMGNNISELLLCDKCDSQYHLYLRNCPVDAFPFYHFLLTYHCVPLCFV